MKTVKLTVVAFIISLLFASCGGNGVSKVPATAEGFATMEKEIKSKFGENAYFTKLNIIYNESIGNMINVTVTKDPESLQMGQWSYAQGKWQQSSEITLELRQGTKAADFMYQLNDEINLTKLGELIEQSKKHLEKEKGIENSKLDITSILFPKNGYLPKTEYSVNLKPKNGGTTFRFYYNLSGELINMNY